MTIRKIFMLLAVVLLASCTSYKSVPYLQNSDEINPDYATLQPYDARIMPKDLLTITVNTTDPQAAAPFNLTVQTPLNTNSTTNLYTTSQPSLQQYLVDNSGNINFTNSTTNLYTTSQPSLQQYLVDNSGNINFPVLGSLHLGGLTKNQAEALITERLGAYLKETPVVTVRMVNYKISVMGEVTRPGTFTVSNEKINVLEALAMAGDLTIYGIRDNVKLIREDEQGRRSIYTLNLNDANLVLSPYYYMQQNDILYVTPNKAKAKNSDIGNSTTLWVSATSIMVSIASLIVNIVR